MHDKTYDSLYRVIDDILFDFVTYRKNKNKEYRMKNFYEMEKNYYNYDFETDNKFISENEDYEQNNKQLIYNNNIKEDNYNEINHMENILTHLNKRMYPYIIKILDEHEYEGSPIYNTILDREFIAQLVDKVVDRIIKEIEEIEEICTEVSKDRLCRLILLRSLIESSIVCELFSFRRPHYKKYNVLNLD